MLVARRLRRPRRPRRPGRPAPSLQQVAAADGRPVEDLLREVAEFRLALEADLTIAAAAAEVEEPGVVADVVDADLHDLHAMEDRALRGLRRHGRHRTRGASVLRRGMALHTVPLHTVPLLAVAAAVGLAGGLVAPHVGGTSLQSARGAADDQFASLSKAVVDRDDASAVVAARQLHASVAELIDQAADDPSAARDAARLLLAEGLVLDAVPGADGVRMRAQMRDLMQRLQTAAGPIQDLVGGAGTQTTSIAPAPDAGQRTQVQRLLPTAPAAPALPVPAPGLPSVTLRPVPLPSRRPAPTDVPRPSAPPVAPPVAPPAPAASASVPDHPAPGGPTPPDAGEPASPSTATQPTPGTDPTPTATPTPTPTPSLQLPGQGAGTAGAGQTGIKVP